jgi:putative membrane protein
MLHNKDLSRPRKPLEYLRLYLSGFAMGCADLVPGVSGGTMAFILGVYETLINAIKSIDLKALRLGLRLKIGELLEHVPYRFLIALLLGIATAILALSNVLTHLLDDEPTYLFAFFAGLIIASILAIGIRVKWSLVPALAMIVSTLAAFFLVGLPAMEDPGHSAPVLFVSGAIAICAMILPGISGSFILLILGQYRFLLDAVRSFDLVSILPAAIGAVIGILTFSRILSWLLRNHEHATVAALVGFMLGSLRKIWMEGEAGVAIISETGQLAGGQWALVIALGLLGFLLVSLLDHLQTGANPIFSWFWERPRPADVAGQPVE